MALGVWDGGRDELGEDKCQIFSHIKKIEDYGRKSLCLTENLSTGKKLNCGDFHSMESKWEQY